MEDTPEATFDHIVGVNMKGTFFALKWGIKA
jgi:hypothetical protein